MCEIVDKKIREGHLASTAESNPAAHVNEGVNTASVGSFFLNLVYMTTKQHELFTDASHRKSMLTSMTEQVLPVCF